MFGDWSLTICESEVIILYPFRAGQHTIAWLNIWICTSHNYVCSTNETHPNYFLVRICFRITRKVESVNTWLHGRSHDFPSLRGNYMSLRLIIMSISCVNPFTTGNTPVCGWRFDLTNNITVHVVPRKRFFKMF